MSLPSTTDQHGEVVQTHVSSDGKLRFQIVRNDNGETRLGFDGFPWHTHADLLAGHYGPSPDTAIDRFVDDLLNGRSIIALFRYDGSLHDVSVTSDPERDRRYLATNETVEFRHWDGSPVE
jgi:hypothetical protein